MYSRSYFHVKVYLVNGIELYILLILIEIYCKNNKSYFCLSPARAMDSRDECVWRQEFDRDIANRIVGRSRVVPHVSY